VSPARVYDSHPFYFTYAVMTLGKLFTKQYNLVPVKQHNDLWLGKCHTGNASQNGSIPGYGLKAFGRTMSTLSIGVWHPCWHTLYVLTNITMLALW